MYFYYFKCVHIAAPHMAVAALGTGRPSETQPGHVSYNLQNSIWCAYSIFEQLYLDSRSHVFIFQSNVSLNQPTREENGKNRTKSMNNNE